MQNSTSTLLPQKITVRTGGACKKGGKCRRFIAGIEPYLQLRIHEQGVDTLDAALTFALQNEQEHQASKVVLPSYSQQWTSSLTGSLHEIYLALLVLLKLKHFLWSTLLHQVMS